jgi:hypothetical protein
LIAESMRALGCALAIGLAGCANVAKLDLPSAPGSRSLLFVVLAPGRDPSVYALGAEGDGRAVVSLNRSDELYALFLTETLAEIELEAGPIEMPPRDRPGRPLPEALASFILDRASGETWRALSAPSAELAGVRLPARPLSSCGDPSCVRRRGGAAFCETPCAAPDWKSRIAPPIPPERPRIQPCPDRWTILRDDFGLETCAPAEAAPDCDVGDAQLLGDASCSPLGAPCPVGQFADDLPAEAIQVAPSDVLGERIARAPAGAVIALAKGTFTTTIAIDRTLTFIGACPALTVLAAPAGSRGVLVRVAAGADVAVRGLRLSGTSSGAILEVEEGATLDLSGTAIARGGELGVVRGSLAFDRVRAHDVAGGLRVIGPSAAAHIAESRFDAVGGYAVAAVDGAQLDLDRVWIRGARLSGPVAPIVRPCEAPPPRALDPCDRDGADWSGLALYARDGAGVRVRASLFEENEGSAVLIDAASSSISSSLIRRNGGFGFETCGDARFDADRVVLDRNELSARFDGHGAIRDLVVRDSPAMQICASQAAALERAYFDSSAVFALILASSLADVRATDLEVHRTRPHLGVSGAGIELRGTHSASIERVSIEDVRGNGFTDLDNGHLELSDALIRTTTSAAFYQNCSSAYSADCTKRGSAHLARVVFSNNTDLGIRIAASTAVIEDAIIADTVRLPGATQTDAAGLDLWSPVAIDTSASAHLERFLFSRNGSRGIYVEVRSDVTLKDGEISDQNIGLTIGSASFDPGHIEDGVVYRRNQIDVDRLAP